METTTVKPIIEAPPVDTFVLARTEELGYWQAKYLPDMDVDGYQPEAWEFVGLDGYKEEVLEWLPFPKVPMAATPRNPR